MIREAINYKNKVWSKYTELRTEMIERVEKVMTECNDAGYATLGEITALRIGYILEHLRDLASASEGGDVSIAKFGDEVMLARGSYISLMEWYCKIRYKA